MSRRQRLLVVAEEEKRPRTWREELAFWGGRIAALGYVASLLFHVVLLIVLAITVVAATRGSLDEGGWTVVASDAEDPEVAFDEVLDTRIAAAEFEASRDPTPIPLDAVRPDPEQAPSRKFDDELTRLFNESLAQAGGGRKNAVTKGSFTVWTEPENPAPSQAYFIYIEMQVPSRIQRLTVRDLDGSVHGTDGYIAEIPSGSSYFLDGRLKRPASLSARIQTRRAESGDFAAIRNDREPLDVSEGAVLLRVWIPGAEVNVRDKIRIRSKSLREEQELQIQFGGRPRASAAARPPAS
ncbi:MAG: hypothetical protein WD069_13240 [Planctomycetales bacterium]